MSSTAVVADPTGGRPVVPSRGALRPLGLSEVRLTGGFWHERQRVNGEATLDHGRSWMDKLGWTGNFTTVEGGHAPADRHGREFTDSEVYKLIEATAWEAGRSRDADLEAEIAGLTALIGGAQSPDGYLNTAFGRPGQRPRYSDLAMGHELYCTGHLLQAAVARARTAGADPLLDIARRAADEVCRTFGPDARQGICGHPEIEPALVEFARLTGDQRYLDQAALFVQRRGHRTLPEHRPGRAYYSDDVPVRETEAFRGHAVRALYLAAGAVDVAVETGDDELLGAVVRQFRRTLARRTYVTGGMGSRYADEGFGDDFVLPADRAYSETCAGVAAAMLAWRLLLATGDARYGDIVERVLYNVVATSIGDDGRSFFYANTLHQRMPAQAIAADHEQLVVGAGQRAPWFLVSCCLPNIARLLASLSAYVATADPGGVQIHEYADSVVRTRMPDGRPVGLEVRTDYPDSGAVSIRVTEAGGGPWAVTLRVPDWASGAILIDPAGRREVGPGTAVVRRNFAVGDEIRLELPVRPRWTLPDPRIDAVRGCVAVERGPLVYCVESTDPTGEELDALRIDPAEPPAEDPLGVTVRGRFDRYADASWPYGRMADVERSDAGRIRLVPYQRWARGGPSTMRVWLPTG
jgi:hypothetical protein